MLLHEQHYFAFNFSQIHFSNKSIVQIVPPNFLEIKRIKSSGNFSFDIEIKRLL